MSGLVAVPALLALLFSISTPGTLARPQIEPLFDEASAAILAGQLSSDFPSRVPGTPEAADAARWLEQMLGASGIPTETQAWRADVPDLGVVDLVNVVGVVPGRSDETILVVAHRDNRGPGERSGENASGTAALLELARGFAPQGDGAASVPRRTLVFVSTDGGAYGGAGASHFARTSPYAERALAAVVLDGIGGGGRPLVALGSDRVASPSRALVSTVVARVADQAGAEPGLPSVLEQLVGLGLPFGIGEQAPLLAEGVAAVSLTTREAGEPPVPVGDPGTPLSTARLGQLGRAAEAVVVSVDDSVGAGFRTPDTVFFSGRVASGWAFRLTLVVLVVPFALGVVDLVARARRRGLAFRPAARALRARLLFWTFVVVVGWLGSLLGALPSGAALALPPYSEAVEDAASAGAVLLLALVALGWLVARRPLLAPPALDPGDRLAGYAVALAWLLAVAIAAAIAKPYALVFVLPSLYAWLWLPLQRWRPAALGLYGLGLVGPVVGLAVVAGFLGLGLLDTLSYLASLAAVGYVSLPAVLLGVAWLGAAAQIGAIAAGRYGPYAAGAEPPPPGLVRSAVGVLARRGRRRRYVRAT